MMWVQAMADLNAIELATFGQPVTVTVGGTETVLQGIHSAPYAAGQDPIRSPFTRPDHRVTFQTPEFEATGAREGDAVTVGGCTFYIADRVADEGGMTTVTLRLT